MNKLKVAIDELRSHLGRDGRGVNLLSAVTTIANQYRKDLAAAVDAKASAERTLAIARCDLAKAESTIASLKDDVARVQSLCEQRTREITTLQSDISVLNSRIDKLLPDDLPELERTEQVKGFEAETTTKSLVDDLRHVTDLFNATRRDFRIAPAPDTRKLDTNSFYFYEITDIAQNLSPAELLKLGRFVAVMALFNFPCGVRAGVVIKDRCKGRTVPERVLEPFVKWFRRNVVRCGDSLGDRGFLPRS